MIKSDTEVKFCYIACSDASTCSCANRGVKTTLIKEVVVKTDIEEIPIKA
jgi:hypothetical protein